VDKGAVGPVVDQGLCPDREGYAWAGAVAGAFQIMSGRLGTYYYDPQGEPQHPFPGQNSWLCSRVAAEQPETPPRPSSFQQVRSGDEVDLMRAVNLGPAMAGIDASTLSFLLYHQGVYDDPFCSTTHLNQAVGYGTDPDGQDYWLVKNSWGTHWGEAGYIRILRNHNVCGIATNAWYAIA
jgi:hypothetical protein